ncbi:hypothetical protein T265_01908 [Opisthorchis viverrini]|uniref:Uncharacterized protein n=1 Tax=Opisthorchis viverrini TaxID=6198 RepID=A0A075AIP2_OPIVI|nr:hypothetical protein T265_01908 [Opisthorchis viverrini]KER31979.1 hypothetical protein T265_01908 [Opisthorchis viverrini]
MVLEGNSSLLLAVCEENPFAASRVELVYSATPSPRKYRQSHCALVGEAEVADRSKHHSLRGMLLNSFTVDNDGIQAAIFGISWAGSSTKSVKTERLLAGLFVEPDNGLTRIASQLASSENK